MVKVMLRSYVAGDTEVNINRIYGVKKLFGHLLPGFRWHFCTSSPAGRPTNTSPGVGLLHLELVRICRCQSGSGPPSVLQDKIFTMKTIYFIRHAKSSWDDPALNDHDRPLNPRGRRDAPRMAARLADLGVQPDGILTSTARRARQTAEYFREALNVPVSRFRTNETLYHAWPDVIAARVRELPDEWNTVLLFGHNPGYTDLANRMDHQQFIDNVPTCGIVAGVAEIDEWNDFRLGATTRKAFLYPKQMK